MPSKNRRNNRQPRQITKRTRATIWVAIVFDIANAIVLVTATVWEDKTAPWAAPVLEQRAGLLALVAATIGLLSIIVSTIPMPRAFLTTIISGGLTGYAAVISAFDPLSWELAAAILIASAPIFMLWSSVWRMPRRWEWAGWSFIGSAAMLVIVVATVNTPLAVLVVFAFGEDTALAILWLATGVGLFTLVLSTCAFVVKAIAMGLAASNE